jgi:hypothetical protein
MSRETSPIAQYRAIVVPAFSQRFERALHSEGALPQAELPCFVSVKMEIRLLSPVVEFRCRDGANRFLQMGPFL